MKINTSPVTYSSIVAIGENVMNIEKQTGRSILKLHRGVMDVTSLDINSLNLQLDLNDKKLQQYGGNDGHPDLINFVKSKIKNSDVLITPGGMAALDLLINSLSETEFWVPTFHWGSWSKILKIHNKTIKTFNDMQLEDFNPTSGVVMLCYPSNPTGYCPTLDIIQNFISNLNPNVTLILDLPYYWMYNDWENGLLNNIPENVIIVSSFSKSIGLSGYRVGFIATQNKELHSTMRIRSLYKYNSISVIPQIIVNEILKNEDIIKKYKKETISNIDKNINYVISNEILFEFYPEYPIGPFVIVNIPFDKLLENNISSVPLNKFTLDNDPNMDRYSRISVAVNHEIFKSYMDKLK